MIPVGILNKAIKTAESSNYYPYKIGVVIFKSDRIISTGKNNIRSCKKLKDKYKVWKESLHAEQDAIINAKRDLNGFSMLIIRIKDGKLFMAKPCDMCMGFIKFVGIKYIYYSDRLGQIVREKVLKS
jgi:deoxycytidylate deaminase